MFKKLSTALKIFLAFILSAGNLPLAFAQEITTQPVIVMPRGVYLTQGIERMDHATLNLGRVNRDDEMMIRQLIDENDLLTQALCERQRTVIQLRQQVSGITNVPYSDSSCGSFSTINKGLQDYSRHLIKRDQQMIAQQANVSVSPQYTASSENVLELMREVEQLRANKPEVLVGNDQGAAASTDLLNETEERVNAKLVVLEQKLRAMEEKGASLQEFKEQVGSLNSQLKTANTAYENLIQQYNETIKGLKSEWAADKGNQGRYKEAHAADQELLGQLTAQNNRLNHDIQKARQDVVGLASQQVEINRLTKALNDKADEVVRLTEQWNKGQAFLLELKNKLTTSDATLATINETIKSKDLQITQLNDQLAKAKADLLNAQQKIDSVNKIIAEDQQKIDSANKAVAEHQQKLAQVEGQVRDKEQVINLQGKAMSGLRLDVQSWAQKADDASKELSAKAISYGEVQQNLVALKELIARQKIDLATKDVTIASLQEEISASKLHVASTDLSTEEATALIVQLREKVGALKEDFASRDFELSKVEGIVKALRAEVNSLKQQVADRDNVIKSKDVSILENEKVLSIKEGIIRENKLALKTSEEKVVKLNTLLKQALAIVAQTEVELKKIDGLSLQVEQLAKKTQEKDRVIASQQAMINEQNKMLQQGQALNEQLVEKVQAKEKTAAENAKVLSEQQGALTQVSKDNSQLKASLTLAQDLLMKKQEQIDLLKQMVGLFDEQQETYMRQISALEAKAVNVVARQQEARDKDQQLIANASQELKDKEEQLALIGVELKKRANEALQLSSMLDVYQDKLKNSNGKYELQLQEVLSAKKHQGELEAQIAQLVEIMAMKDEQVKKTKEYFVELERRYSTKDQDIKAKDLSLSMLQSMIDQNTKEHSAKITGMEQQLQSQSQQLKGLREQLALADEQLKAEVTALTAQLKEKEDLLAQIKSESGAKVKDFDGKLAEIEQLKVELNNAQDKLMKAALDMQYKQKEVVRLKEISKAKELELKKASLLSEELAKSQSQINALKVKLKTRFPAKPEITASVPAQPPQVSGDQHELEFLRKDIKAMAAKLKEASVGDNTVGLRAALAEAREKLQATTEELHQQKRMFKQLEEQAGKAEPKIKIVPAE